MNDTLARETEGLVKSWMRHDETMLRDYLVAEVEDPRINIQSILTRNFLVEAIFGPRFAALMNQELQFGLVMNWVLGIARKTGGSGDFPAIMHALQRGADNAEGLPIPHYVSRIYRELPATANGISLPHYLTDYLAGPPVDAGKPLDHETPGLFQRAWRSVLVEAPTPRLKVMEAACGSANDYRFIEGCGLGRLLDYTGFDLCEKNVANARALFPAARFEAGNVFEIPAADQSCDVCFLHDLLEHLSPEGLEAAVAELCRVTRRSLCIGCFSMHEGAEHLIRPVEDYHWNTLSVPRTRRLFERHAFQVEIIHIGTFLELQFRCRETHNPNAYTLLASRPPGAAS